MRRYVDCARYVSAGIGENAPLVGNLAARVREALGREASHRVDRASVPHNLKAFRQN